MFELREQASPISEVVMEIRINSHLVRENNLTTRHVSHEDNTGGHLFAMTIKESGPSPTLP
jgi:hypothetical protein